LEYHYPIVKVEWLAAGVLPIFEKYQYGYKKNAEFYADFNFVDADLNKCP
jgi:hypothetical protein